MTEQQSIAPQTSVTEPDSLDLESHRKEQFAHAVAFGAPYPIALQQAGYKVTTPALAFNLLKDEVVTAIIDADRAWLRDKIKISQEQIVAQLDADRAFAYSCENPAAAVAATMNKAKVVGIADPHSGKGMPRRLIIEWADQDELAAEETGT